MCVLFLNNGQIKILIKIVMPSPSPCCSAWIGDALCVISAHMDMM